MRQIESPQARQQKFAASRGHGVVNVNFSACSTEHFCSHQARRTGTYDGNAWRCMHRHVSNVGGERSTGVGGVGGIGLNRRISQAHINGRKGFGLGDVNQAFFRQLQKR